MSMFLVFIMNLILSLCVMMFVDDSRRSNHKRTRHFGSVCMTLSDECIVTGRPSHHFGRDNTSYQIDGSSGFILAQRRVLPLRLILPVVPNQVLTTYSSMIPLKLHETLRYMSYIYTEPKTGVNNLNPLAASLLLRETKEE